MINSPIGDNETPCPLCPQIWHFRRSEGVSTTNVGVKAPGRVDVDSPSCGSVLTHAEDGGRSRVARGERSRGFSAEHRADWP